VSIEAVLFDFNGVVIDDEPVHCDAFREVLTPRGIEFTDAEYYGPLLGIPDREFLKRLLVLRGASLPADQFEEILATKSGLYNQWVTQRDVDNPGLRDFVRELAAHVPLGVVSGALRPEIEFHLDRLGLGDLFRVLVAAGEYEATKPDPAPYQVGLRKLSAAVGRELDPARVIAVEDSTHGVTSARAAGMGVVGFCGRIAPERLHGSFLLVENFTGLAFAGLNQAFCEAFS